MFNRGAYTTIGDVCKKKKSPFKGCQLSSTHMHTLNMSSGQVHYIPLGYPWGLYRAHFALFLTTLNKRAYARCEMYAQLPGVGKPTDVPD